MKFPSYAASLALAVLLTGYSASAARAQSYSAVVLPIGASAINDAGQVVGSGTNHAALWQNGSVTDLGTLPGGSSSWANGINNAGQAQVVGASMTLDTVSYHAFLWQNGTMTDLGTLPGHDRSEALAVNDSGQVVGSSRHPFNYDRAFLWDTATGMHDLGTLGGYWSVARAINGSGQVVGYSDTGTIVKAFLWTPTVPNGTTGSMVALDTRESWAHGINSSSEAVGTTGSAVLWDSAGVAHDLGFLPGYGDWSSARGINNGAQVVGFSLLVVPGGPDGMDSEVLRAFVWDSASGMRDLNNLISSGPEGPFSEAPAINNAGQIVVKGADTGYLLLTPSALPPRPSNLTAAAGFRRVDLSWDAGAGAATYNVKRSTTSGGPYTVVSSGVTATSYSDTAVANGTTYYYVVSAVNAYGESNSNESSATPFLSPPTWPWAQGGDHKVTLAWSASPDTNIYNVKRSNTSGGPYTIIASGVTGLSYIDTAAVNGTHYFYRISAVSGPDTADSSEVTAMPSAVPPAPTNLSASGAKGKVNLKWTQSTGSGVTQNRVYRSTTNGGAYTVVAAISAGTSYTDTAVVGGTTYYYRVTAVTVNGQQSAYSNQASGSAR